MADANPFDDLVPETPPEPTAANPFDDLVPVESSPATNDDGREYWRTPALDAPAIGGMRAVPLVPDAEEEDKKDNYLRALFEAGFSESGDEYAETLALQEATGARIDDVKAALPEFKRSVETAKFDPRRWRADNPALYDLLVEQPRLAPIVMKDEKVSFFTKAIRKARAAWIRADHTEGNLPNMGTLHQQAMRSTMTPEQLAAEDARDAAALAKAAELAADRKTPQIESPLRGAAIYADQYRRSRLGTERSYLGWDLRDLDRRQREAERSGDPKAIDAARKAAFEVEAQILRLDEEIGVQVDYGQGPVEQLGLDVVEGGTSSLESLKSAGIGAAGGAAVGFGVGLATRNPVGGTLRGMAAGAKLVPSVTSMQLEGGDAYLELRKARTDTGELVDPEIASVASLVYGMAAAGIEVASLGPALKAFGPLGEAIYAGKGKKWMKEALADRAKRGVFRSLLKDWAKSAGAEAGEEAAQLTAQEVANWAARSATSGSAESFDVEGLVFERAPEAAYKGGVGALGIGTGQMAVSYGTQLYHHQRSRRAGSTVASIAELADSPTARAAPKVVARMVEAETARTGEAVKSLYIDPSRLVDLVTREDGDIDAVARDLMGEEGPARLKQALQEADETEGGRATLEVPVAEYLERWGTKPIAEHLKDDVTTTRGLLTAREQVLFQDETDQMLEQMANEDRADDAANGVSPAEREFADVLEDQLVESGSYTPGQARLQTAQFRAVVRIMGKKMPTATVDEQFKRWTLEVRRANEGNLPASLGAIRESYQGLDEGAQALTYHTDRNTGLRNERGMQSMVVPEGRGTLAVFDLEGGKRLNDSFGHEALDGGYRAMAGVLAGQGIADGGKVGGSIVAYVRDQAHAHEIAQAMSQGVDPKLRVTYGLAESTGDFHTTLDAAHAQGKDAKGELYDQGDLGHRLGVPAAFVQPGDPAIKWDKDAKDMPGLPHDSPEALAIVQRAVEGLAPTAERVRGAQRVTESPLEVSQQEAFTRDRNAADTIYLDPTGLLTEDGFAQARKVAPKRYQMSADMRGLKRIDQAFGRRPADAIKHLFGEVLRDVGGGRFDLANLHGDEYAAQADDADAMRAFAEDADAVLRELVFYFEREDGSVVVQNGLSFAYGIDPDFDRADRTELAAYKARQKPIPAPEIYATAADADRALEGSGRKGDRGPIRVQSLVDRLDKIQAEAAAGIAFRERVSILGQTDRVKLQDQLQKAGSRESRALAELTAKRTIQPPKASIRSRSEGWSQVMAASFPEDGVDGSPTRLEDSQYRAALEGKGKMPPPLEGGTLDAVNGYLDLKGRKRASSVQHGFDLLMKQFRGEGMSTADAVEASVNVLRDVPGMEGLQMPEEYIEQRAAEEMERGARDAEWSHWEEDDPSKLFQPASTHGNLKPMAPTRYIRFGELPARGHSLNHADQFAGPQAEAGVSVYREVMVDGKWVLDNGSLSDPALYLNLTLSGRPAYVVSGDEVGFGGDGEPLLANAKVVESLGEYRAEPGAEGFPGAGGHLWRDSATGKYKLVFPKWAETIHTGWYDTPAEALASAPEYAQERGQMVIDAVGKSNPEILYQPSKEDSHRGYVRIQQDAMQSVFKVFLNERSDMSTFLHESAHIYWEMMGDLAAHPDADQQLRDDYQAALDWMGAADRESVTREQKEQWARGFEAYFLEGKSPSVGLAEMFQSFRLWLREVYTSLTELDVELDDSIRGVFDRMLATDAEIDRMKAASGLAEPLWKTADDAGMTPEQWDLYLRERVKLSVQTAQQVQRAVAEAQRRALEAYKTDKFRQMRGVAEVEWSEREDVMAWRYLRLGERRLDDGRVVKNSDLGKIDRDTAIEMLGKGHPLIKRLRGRLVKKDGNHPNTIAEILGFTSGRAMFEAVATMPADQRAWVNERAAELLKERDPKIEGETARLDRLIQRLLHEGSDNVLRDEYESLNRRMRVPGTPGRLADRGARDVAKAKVDGQLVSRLANEMELQREQSAAREAALASARQDYERASAHALKRMLHHHTWRELDRAQQDLERFRDLAGRLTEKRRREIMGKAGGFYLGTADQILEALGLKAPEPEAERMSLELALFHLENGTDTGAAFRVDEVLRIVSKPPENGWRGLTVEQMREVHRALSQLWTQARDEATIIVDGQAQDRQQLIDDMATEMSARPDKGQPQRDPGWLTSYAAGRLEPQEVIRRMGPTAYKTLWVDFTKAQYVENELLRAVGEKIANAWQRLPKAMQKSLGEKMEYDERIATPEDIDTQAVTDRRSMLMVAFNMGNPSNRERLCGGYKWDPGAVLDWLNENMTQEEWAFVESVWKLLDKELFPKVSEVYEKATGLKPEKIEATPIATPYGVVSGGYFPARYNPVASRLGADQSLEQLEKNYHQRSGQISVSRGFTKARARQYSDVVDLDWGVVPGHVMSVVHYIAFDQYVRQSRRIMTDRAFATAANHYVGDANYQNMVSPDAGWLAAVSSAASDAIPRNLRWQYRILGVGRSVMTTAAIGWSVSTAVADLVDPIKTVATGRVQARHMLASMAKAYSGAAFPAMRRRAMDLSAEVRHRSENIQRHVRGQLEEIGRGKPSILQRVQDTAWVFLDMSDRLVTTLTWDAAYNEAQAKGLRGDLAVRYADDVVQSSMPVQDQARKPPILRDKRGLAQGIMFFSYFSKVYNQIAAQWDPVFTEWGLAEEFGDRLSALPSVVRAAGSTLAIAGVAQVFGEFMSGRGRDEDEETEDWILRKMLAFGFMLFPWLAAPGEYTVNRLVSPEKAREFNARGSPGGAAIERGVRAVQKVLDEDREDDQRILDVMELIGLGLRLPPGAASFGRVRRAAEEGGAEDPLDAASDLVYGRRRGNPANPFRPSP